MANYKVRAVSVIRCDVILLLPVRLSGLEGLECRAELVEQVRALRIHDVLLVLAGITGLLAKKWLSPALGELTLSYLGNLSASFSVYFLVRIAFGGKLGRLAIAGVALAVIETFELTNGFGLMSNVYDPFDYAANALGIAAAILVDMIPFEKSTHGVQA